MTPLLKKMKQEMILAGLEKSTQKVYYRAAARFDKHYSKQTEELTAEEIRDYLLYLLEDRELSSSTYNTHVYALRFLYGKTLHRPSIKSDLPRTKAKSKSPEILSREEVQRIIQATGNIKHRTLLMVIYGSGLRIAEALNVQEQRQTIFYVCQS